MQQMFFSVIIPTCNRPGSLKRCLDALGGNHISTFNHEIIVGDDSTGDETKNLLQNEFPAVKYVKSNCQGPAGNRNNAARLARGKWLLFLDDDCVPGQYLLAIYYRAIEKNPLVEVFEGSILPDVCRTRFDQVAPINYEGGNLWACNFVILNNTFSILHGFDEHFRLPLLEDIDLRCRIQKTRVIQFVPEAMVMHSWKKGMGFSLFKQRLDAHRYFFKKHGINNLKQRVKRSIFFLKELVKLTGHLVKYSFTGVNEYFGRLAFQFCLIFY